VPLLQGVVVVEHRWLIALPIFVPLWRKEEDEKDKEWREKHKNEKV